MDKIRILLVSNFVLLRDGLRALLTDCAGCTVIGESAIDASTITAVQALKPDVVLLESSRNESEVLNLVTSLRALTRIIVISPVQDPDLVLWLLRAGVHGYLSNEESHDELAQAVHTVARNEVFLCASASKALLTGFREQTQAHRK